MIPSIKISCLADPRSLQAPQLDLCAYGCMQIGLRRLPFAFGKLRNIEEVMFLANPYVFPAASEFSKGKEHIMWLCRQEGHKYFKGPPPAPRLLQYGIAEEGCLYESEFLKNLKEKMKEAATTKFLNLNFNNMPVSKLE